MLTFAQELRHVAPVTDTDGATIHVVEWPVARGAFMAVMSARNGWTYRAWTAKNLVGSLDEQVDQFAAKLTGETACWIREEAGVPTMVRIYRRLSIPEVHVIFGTATKLDYTNVTDHRALWDIGVRRIVAFADSGWTHYFERIHQRGYIVDAVQPANNAPGVLRMVKTLKDRP